MNNVISFPSKSVELSQQDRDILEVLILFEAFADYLAKRVERLTLQAEEILRAVS